MARFNQTASYAGKGQKDLADRVATLKRLGHLPADAPSEVGSAARRLATEAEKAAGLTWHSGNMGRERGYWKRDESGALTIRIA